VLVEPPNDAVTRLLADGRVVIVSGKGGVGKTTVVAALALAAAAYGRRVQVIDVEGRPVLATRFGAPAIGWEPTQVAPGVFARVVAPDRSLTEWMEGHGLKRLAGRLASAGALDVIATATPGMKDILVLGKVKQLTNDAPDDFIVVDAPASGHAIQFLKSPLGLLDAVRGGPIRNQAEQVQELLADHSRCQVVLVTLAEATPVQETIETAFALEERVGIALGPIVVNQVAASVEPLDISAVRRIVQQQHGRTPTTKQLKALEDTHRFLAARHLAQQGELENLAQRLALPQLRLPELASTAIGPREVAVLATQFSDPVGGEQ
jgi:anion-transporting  ArsA/GET3 family ATPase